VFASATPYFARVPIYVSGIWSWTFASETVQPLEFDQVRAEALEKHTRFYNRDIHHSVFAQPNDIKAVLGD
jgi:spermidine synthase